MAKTERTDMEVISLVRAGDEDAFGVLCDRYHARMQARARRWLTAPLLRKVSVADILQEAYYTALERLHGYEDRGEGSFGHWLGAIVDNKARHALRRYQGTAKRAAFDEVTRGARRSTVDFPARGPSPSQVAIARELREEVRRAMDRLPRDYREILRLRQELHLTLQEAAARMGRSVDAIKMLYGRALTRLGGILEEK